MPYDNSMQGVIFQNKKKPEGSKQPDYRGTCEIDGKTYEIAGWKKVAQKSGDTFLSLKFQMPRDTVQEAVDAAKPKQAQATVSDEDDIPF